MLFETLSIESPISASLFLSTLMFTVGSRSGWAICTSLRKGTSFRVFTSLWA